MRLFEIQDQDRQMYVLASSWTHALAAWKDRMALENPDSSRDCNRDDFTPLGIKFLADNDSDYFPNILIQKEVGE